MCPTESDPVTNEIEDDPVTNATESDPVTNGGFAFDSLEGVRKKLLDLSGRNTLLNFRHPKTSVRLIDELPDQIYDELHNGKTFTFIPVPEPTEEELIDAGYITVDLKAIKELPTAEQWAKHKGFVTEYELPENEISKLGNTYHQDNNLQTLLYAPLLEARLRSISGKARTSIQESGSNILYLAIGFLEWFEVRNSDVKRSAPLFTIPVVIERSKTTSEGVFRYMITLKEDELLTNITLKEKLANDFDLVLPEIEDEITPENYFKQVQNKIILNQPNWKIKRQATLVLLNFTKQAMYQDLNPNNWPANNSIAAHPLIKKFFTTSGQTDETDSFGYFAEHPIDDVKDIHDQFPLVFDADSSQHSALIDAVNGENLVIEGPPGTGKSQTIANIIAASIANGKQVLFVAEKMAALNVVKDRLDKIELGDFCLELHSHKTNKTKIVHDLGVSLNKQRSYRIPKDIKVDIERFEFLKLKLHEYAELINSEWKKTGLTLHEIFSKATRYREQLGIDPDSLKIDGLSGAYLTLIKQKELIDQADILHMIYDQVSDQVEDGEISHHYWYGVENTELMGFQATSLHKSLEEWTISLQELDNHWSLVNQIFAMDKTIAIDLNTIWHISASISKLPELGGGELIKEIKIISEQLGSFKEMLENYESIHQRHEELSVHLKVPAINEAGTSIILCETEEVFKKLGLQEATTLNDIAILSSKIEKSREQITALENDFGMIRLSIPNDLQQCFIVSQNGLKEFKSLARLISELPENLWRYRNEIYDNPDLDPLLEQMTKKLTVLTPLHKKIQEHVILDRLPEIEELKKWESILDNAGLFKWFSPEWRKTKKEVLFLSTVSKPELNVLIQLLPEIVLYLEGIRNIDSLHEKDDVLGEDYDGVDTPIDRILELRNWYKSVRTEYGIGFGDRVAIGNSLINLDRSLGVSINEYASHNLKELADKITLDMTDFMSVFTIFEPFNNKNFNLASICKDLAKEISGALESLGNIVGNKGLDLIQLKNISLDLPKQQQEIAIWEKMPITKQLTDSIFPLRVEAGNFSKQLLAIGKNTYEIINVLVDSPNLLVSLTVNPTEQNYRDIKQCLPDLQKHELLIREASQKFVDIGSVKMSEWEKSSEGIIGKLIARNNSALDNPKWLDTWLEYIRLRLKMSSHGLDSIVKQLEKKLISSEDLNSAVKLLIYHQLANEVLKKHKLLANFSGMEQKAYRDKFQEYDRNLISLQRELVAYKASRKRAPAGISTGRIRDYTELGLISHNLNLKTPRVAVRKLIKESAKSMQALKPCFMMSPMSVAQYLLPGEFHFDLVIMDEASQIRPEDALGAIARGNNLVVVGDPKQLPPTSFFQKIVNNDDNDDATTLDESGSILESVIPMFKNRRLRWHYRSRHESLIAFSNLQFYDSNLILFPSPLRESDEFGVKFSRVKDGRFINRRNVDEAREIVQATAEQLINNPKESVGVVAMNSDQTDEIERQLEQKVKDDPQLQKAYEDNKNLGEPLFIKNLENVQGDERDVIVISMTYGPQTLGASSMHQRFGPINSDVGWRRLNVLFTRSKKRMLVFSSMDSGHVKTSANSSKGVKALQEFLHYCETGIIKNHIHTGKPPDSDFEISVMDALAKHGYDCEPQLGVTGYFLDMAVIDPGMPGKFLMGIECDGASYHSAKSTRDRDRLRQDILENLGWKIRRIWSTDWFKNPQAQLQPILKELETLKTATLEVTTEETNALNPEAHQVIGGIMAAFEGQGNQIDSKMSLSERLTHFDVTIIRKNMPNVDDRSRLLRPAMLEELLGSVPSSKAEFLETIPAFLRLGTDPKEASEYLDDVLKLISSYK